MCWSGEASAALATVGFGTAFYVARKGESKGVRFKVMRGVESDADFCLPHS